MIIIERMNVNHIPVLNIVKHTLREQSLPTVIYYHGFNGEKESSLTIAYKIAEKGMRVILPDAPLHGERSVSEEPINHGITFWEIVLQMIEEVALIKNYLKEKELTQLNKIGFGGTSMGGMVTYACLRKYSWIKAAVVLMGTPYLTKRAMITMEENSPSSKELLTKIKELDITEKMELLNERPIFIWHGEKDAIVPVADSKEFFEQSRTYYTNKEQIEFIEEKDRIHNISKLSIRKTAEWFENQLL